MRRYRIKIRTASETALMTCVARNAAQAWDVAFDLAKSLLGTIPPRHNISVRLA